MRVAAGTYAALLQSLLGEGRPAVLVVRGFSMLPAIADGATIKVRALQGDEPRRGQVVLLRQADGSLLCHRIVRLWKSQGNSWVQTWGDCAPCADRPVMAGALIGIVSPPDGDAFPPGPSLPRLRLRSLKRRLICALARRAAGAEPTTTAEPPATG